MTPRRRLALVLGIVTVAGCARPPVPRTAPYIASDADVSVTRIVHGSVVVSLHGTRVLVDPWMDAGWVFRQTEALGLVPDTLPTVRALLLTHEHRDHYDPALLRRIAPRIPLVLTPPGLADRVRELGFTNVVALDWWETARVDDVAVTAVPANHPAHENGYVLEREGRRVYVAGDTRPFPELVDVATRFPKVDVALLPIGGQRLLGVLREMTPEQAAAAAKLLDARRVIPIHYGETGGAPFYWYAGDPVGRLRTALEHEGVPKDRLVVLQPGESWHEAH